MWAGAPVVAIGLLAAFWNWDWLIPVVQSRISNALGRPVTIAHLHVRPGWVTEISADGVSMANPTGWNDTVAPFASLRLLTVSVDTWGYIWGHGLTLPAIGIEGLKIFATEAPDGATNFQIAPVYDPAGPVVKVGDIRIADSDARVLIPTLKADFALKIATENNGDTTKIVIDTKGTYAAQPVTGRLVGGGQLSLPDTEHPWPIAITLANGATHLALNGTLRDPYSLQGADVRLRIDGPDMALLEHLTGFPIPTTPPYQIAGKLSMPGVQMIRFDSIQGRIGISDIAGSIEEQLNATQGKLGSKPVVTMDLRSKQVDLKDLSGFIGGTPGRTADVIAKTDAKATFLPNTPISVPRLDWADIHLRYHGAHIQGRNLPLDDLTVVMDVVGGNIAVHPISAGVGKGKLLANFDLAPRSDNTVHLRLDLHLENLDVSRIMAATNLFEGSGSISGVGALEGTGDSFASLLANGNGQVKMAMAGGNLSAVLVDLTGLEFGNALLSALGVPHQTSVKCFVGDLGLRRGLVDFRSMTLDTGEAIVNIGGTVDLAKETIDLGLKTDAKHFSIGSVPGRLSVGGTFKNPSFRPGVEAVARAGAIAGLAALFAPLAILPTVQFGTSDADDARCDELLRAARAAPGGKVLPPVLPPAR
jgi:uncharacterized protein involved in outer membrane biogenesis